MKAQLAILFLWSFSSSVRAEDTKIAALVAELSKKRMWSNGMFPRLNLPAVATPPTVVARCLDMVSFDSGRVKHYEIRATEKVTFQYHPGEVTAVLINSNLGEKIILMRYEGSRVGWWTRVFDAK